MPPLRFGDYGGFFSGGYVTMLTAALFCFSDDLSASRCYDEVINVFLQALRQWCCLACVSI